MTITGTGSAALVARMIGQLEDAFKEDRKEAAAEQRDASENELKAMIESADRRKLAAKEDMAFQNVDGTFGQIPIAGKIGVTAMTAGKQDLEFMGVMGVLAGPAYAPIGLALLGTAEARPALRDSLEAGSKDPLIDNAPVKTLAYADREDRDKNKDLANRADIDAKRAGKIAAEAKTGLDEAKKAFQDIVQNMKTVLEDQKRANEKITG